MSFDSSIKHPEAIMDFEQSQLISTHISQTEDWNLDERPFPVTLELGQMKIDSWLFEPLEGIVFGSCGPAEISLKSEKQFYCDAPLLIFYLLLEGSCQMKFDREAGKKMNLEKHMFAWCDWSGQRGLTTLPEQNTYCHLAFSITKEAFYRHLGRANGSKILSMLYSKAFEDDVAYITGPATSELLTAGCRFLDAPKDSALDVLELKATSLDFFSKMLRTVIDYEPSLYVTFCEQDYEAINSLKKQLENEPTANESIRELCSSIGMSQSKASMIFKQLFNTTMSKYQLKCKMVHAHGMLSGRKLNVSECAYELGYTNIGHFIAAFRKHYGITPGDVLAGGRIPDLLKP